MVILLMIAVGVIGANSLVLSPIAAEVARGLGAGSAAEVMTAAAVYGIGVAASAMFLAPRADRIGAAAALKTAIATLLVGLVLSAIKVMVCSKVLLWPSNLRVSLESSEGDQPGRLTLEGAATFMCLPKLAAELGRVSPGSELHIDFTQLAYIDHACLELLNGWNSQHMKLGGTTVADWEALRALFVPQGAAASSPAT